MFSVAAIKIIKYSERDRIQAVKITENQPNPSADERQSLKLAERRLQQRLKPRPMHCGACRDGLLRRANFKKPRKKAEEGDLETHDPRGLRHQGRHAADEDQDEIHDGRGGSSGQLGKLQDARDIDRHCHDDEAGQSGRSAGRGKEKIGPHLFGLMSGPRMVRPGATRTQGGSEWLSDTDRGDSLRPGRRGRIG